MPSNQGVPHRPGHGRWAGAGQQKTPSRSQAGGINGHDICTIRPGDKVVVAPDTDGELTRTLAALEEVLALLQPVDVSEAALPNTGPDELHTLQNICMRLFAAERSGAPQLYAPDGKFEYVPLFLQLLGGRC